jgi:CubicO group peptidase (beta-lactamase class C family)
MMNENRSRTDKALASTLYREAALSKSLVGSFHSLFTLDEQSNNSSKSVEESKLKVGMRLISVPGLILLFAVLLFDGRQTIAQTQSRPARQSPAHLRNTVRRKGLLPRLERIIPQLMKEGDVPGLSIALIRDAKIFWHQSFGVKNADTKEPVGDSTVFEAASLSKPIFTYAVLKLVDSGKLELDKPLASYLSAPYVQNDERVNLITARMVLDHTTGFQNETTPERPLKIYFTPGEKFSYSGEGFLYLQKAVERITGEHLDVFMRKTVFEPLGMKSSSFLWQDRYETLKANGHKPSGVVAPIRRPTVARSYSGLHTTVIDYAKFVIAVINGTGLREATTGQMLKRQVGLDESCFSCLERSSQRLSQTLSWGLGWGLERTDAGEAIWHWGDNNGEFQSFVMAYPKEKIGLAIFTNSGNGLSIIPEIVSLITGGTHPAFAWMGYEAYNSPAKILFRDILARGGAAISQYRESRKKRSDAGILSEAQVNALGYWLLGKKRVKEAVEVFKLNVEDFPNSSNAYDSLGEAYMINGDKELSIKNYQRSLELNPDNQNALEMLRKLRGQ